MKNFLHNLYANEKFPIYLGATIVFLLIAFFVVLFVGKKDKKKLEDTKKLEKIDLSTFTEEEPVNMESSVKEEEHIVPVIANEEKVSQESLDDKEELIKVEPEDIKEESLEEEPITIPDVSMPKIYEENYFHEEEKVSEEPIKVEEEDSNPNVRTFEEIEYNLPSDIDYKIDFTSLANDIESDLKDLEKMNTVLEENNKPLTEDVSLEDTMQSVLETSEESKVIVDEEDVIELPKLKEEVVNNSAPILEEKKEDEIIL